MQNPRAQSPADKQSSVKSTKSTSVPGPRPCDSIRVRKFVDHRQRHHRGFDRIVCHASELTPTETAGIEAIDHRLITQLFARTLQRAGYDAELELDGAEASTRAPGGALVLDGHIWRFHFQTRPTTILELDLSLVVVNAQTLAVLWQLEVPDEDTLPFWVGLGCRPAEMLQAAMQEVEEAAFVEFASERFARAVSGSSKRLDPEALGPDMSHDVVAESSWTATDEGEITATAHESGRSAPASGKPARPRRQPRRQNAPPVTPAPGIPA